MRSLFIKRVVDIVGSLVLLTLAAPVLVAVGVLVRWKLGRPVLFRQMRPGYRGRLFTLYKFRTMREAVDRDNRPLPDNERMTSLGRFLRASSLDELPELWNVLRGDMSLVGPRPLLVEHLAIYTAEQARRHEVKSGLTGWAQIHGRDNLPWEEKMALDVWYVDHWTLWVDARILWKTARAVLRREGVIHPEAATMERFMRSRGGIEYGRTAIADSPSIDFGSTTQPNSRRAA
jgi:lipopolysaccharide/colanic/teichoic acid biosynthesis glycosyltransferase